MDLSDLDDVAALAEERAAIAEVMEAAEMQNTLLLGTDSTEVFIDVPESMQEKALAMFREISAARIAEIDTELAALGVTAVLKMESVQ